MNLSNFGTEMVLFQAILLKVAKMHKIAIYELRVVALYSTPR